MKYCFYCFSTLVSMLISNAISGQNVPIPAPPQTQAILVRGATAHLGDGRVIENSLVAFEQGKFTVVDNGSIKRLFPNHREIEAFGLHLYPGFIAPNTTLGLQEIEQVRATNDNEELGSLNPNIRSLIAYNTDSEIIPTVRAMGILMAETTPQGGRISGASSLVQLDAWNWEDAAYAVDRGIHLNWPAAMSFNFREQRMEKNENYDKELRDLTAFFSEAQAYYRKAQPERVNLRFEAMKGLFSGDKKLFIHAETVQAIQEGVLMAKGFQITPVIVGGRDAWRMTDFLKQNQIAVVLESTQNLPGREDEAIDQPFKTPKLLQEAGILFCIGHNGFWQQRNLGFQAGQAVAFGLPYEAAIQALTLNTAKIFGIEKTAGSVETGKDATFFLCEGDALDMRTSKVRQAFIQGREINLDNKQEILYRRFQAKYKSR